MSENKEYAWHDPRKAYGSIDIERPKASIYQQYIKKPFHYSLIFSLFVGIYILDPEFLVVIPLN